MRFYRHISRSQGGVSLFAMAVISLGAPAYAQEASVAPQVAIDTPADDTANEILVVGRNKTLTNLQDTPVTATVFSGDALESKSLVQMSDIAAFTPGFSVREAVGNATAFTLTMRGQVQGEALATVEPSVGTYVDEVYWARAYGLNTSLVDVSNVQVLKGPQGTLFGRNTSAGAMILTTNDPSFSGTSGKLAATYGRFNEWNTEGVVNVPIGDVLAIRGAIRVSHRDGWARQVRQYDPQTGAAFNGYLANGVVRETGARFGGKDEVQGRLKALIKFGSGSDLTLGVEVFDFKGDSPVRVGVYKVQGDNVTAGTAINNYIAFLANNPMNVSLDATNCDYAVVAGGCSDALRSRPENFTDVNTLTASAKLRVETGVGQVKLIGAYRSISAENNYDSDGTATVMHTSTFTQDLKQYSLEAQLTGSSGGFDYAAGVTYFTESGYDKSFGLTGNAGSIRNGLGTNIIPRNLAYIDNKSFGAYAQGSYKLTDRLTVTGGIRWSQDAKDIDVRSAAVDLFGNILTGTVNVGALRNVECNPTLAAGIPGTTSAILPGATAANDCSSTQSATFRAFSYTAGLDYKVSDDVLLYAKASRGYRSGGHNLRAFTVGDFVPFRPEFNNEQEIGIKSEWGGGLIRFNLAGYHNEVAGIQRQVIRVTNGFNNTIIENADARNLGFEADLAIFPVRGFVLSGALSYNDFKYTNYTTVGAGGVIQDLSNQRVPYVPAWQYSISAQYQASIGSSASLTANVDYAFTGKHAADPCIATGPTKCFNAASGGRTADEITADIIRATTLPGAGVLNARLTFGLDNDRYKIALWGRNIANNRSFLSATWLGASGRNYVSGIRRDPATYGVTASLTF